MYQPLTEANAADILGVLEGIGSVNPAARTEANNQLKTLKSSVDRQTGLAPLLLSLSASDSYSLVARQVSAVAFRDVVKDCWDQHRSESVVQEQDKQAVRGTIFSQMIASPPEVRRTLSSCIEMICKTDFPSQWTGILDEIVGVLQMVDADALGNPGACDALEATLSTAHAVFQRYRELYELTEELKEELLTINSTTAGPLIALLQLSAEAASKSIQDTARATVYIKLFTLTTEVIHDLTTCDLGDEHEQAMSQIVDALITAIHLESPELMGTKYRGGPLLELRSSALAVISRYMLQYDDDMEKHAQRLMQTVWDLISAPSSTTPAADDLVVTALGFFESSCRGSQRELLPPVLEQLVLTIVLPALQLTEDDVETFEDEPDAYIQRDIEGSDAHTRRHSACKLVRALLAVFPCAEVFNRGIGMLLESGTWQARDSAVVLVSAMGLKASSSTAMASGGMGAAASELTEHVDLAGFYEQHISPELTTTGARYPNEAEVGSHVLKADALRFVATFRHHLPPDALAGMLSHLAQFLQADNIVVQSYAAHSIERILSLPSNEAGQQFRLSDAAVAPAVPVMLEMLCGRLSADARLNEYTVKCLAQVLRSAPTASQPFNGDVMNVLAAVLTRMAKNPSNPLFSHYLFEAMGYTLRLAEDNADQCVAIEALLWDPLFGILRDDVVELLPYALQVLALLLDVHPSGSASRSPAAPMSAGPSSVSKIPDHFISLFPPLCSPELFAHKGNVPAAIRLIGSYVRKDPDQMHANSYTQPTLELASQLIMSKLEDHFGFEIIGAVMMHYPRDALDVLLPTVFRMLFDRMQQRPTPKFARMLALFVASVLAKHGAVYFDKIIEGIQPGMTAMVLQQIVLPVVAKVTGNLERKTCAVGLSHAVQDSEVLLNFNGGQLWASCVLQCLSLLHLDAEHDEEAAASAAMVSSDQHASVDDLRNAAVEETGIGSKFVQLTSCARAPEDPCGSISDPRAMFKSCVKAVVDQRPQEAQSLLQANLPPDAFSTLQGYF